MRVIHDPRVPPEHVGVQHTETISTGWHSCGGVVYVLAPAVRKRRALCSCGWQGRRRLLQGCAVTDAHLHAADAGCQPAVPLVWPADPPYSRQRGHQIRCRRLEFHFTVLHRIEEVEFAMSRLLPIEEVACLLGVSESRARDILADAMVTPRAGYPESAVRSLTSFHRAARPVPGFRVVPPDAEMPEMVIHEKTGWEVYPALGAVFSIFTNAKSPQLVGQVKNGHLTGNRTFPDGSRAQYRLARVVWEAVNRRLLPEDWVIRYRNDNRRDIRYSNLLLEHVAEKVERTVNGPRRTQRETSNV
jgi:hypothetical protein